jgi:hypothetical protein
LSNAIRYLASQVVNDLERKMVFLGGPRQVGKTTLAKSLMKNSVGYLNWDVAAHREKILRNDLPETDLWVFDELHKYRKWRGWIKGLYDNKETGKKILVTGSARLDYYRFGGDSLQGRYHFLRLHPLSVAELGIKKTKELKDLLFLGGFPEPYFGGSEIQAKRWSREYRTRLIQDDILSLEQVKDIGTLELLILRLPDLVGSPLSLNALKEDLQVNHKTIDHWISALERMYAIFRLLPFGAPRLRAVKKEQKHYHYDWSLVKNEGMRFENMIACHLLKWVHFMEDSEGRNMELRFFRDAYGHEVDFILMEDNHPIKSIECKLSDTKISPSLSYFKDRFPNCEAVQIVGSDFEPTVSPSGIKVIPAIQFLANLI